MEDFIKPPPILTENEILLNKYKATLEQIAEEKECDGPGCPYCESNGGIDHPYSHTAKLAQIVLNQNFSSNEGIHIPKNIQNSIETARIKMKDDLFVKNQKYNKLKDILDRAFDQASVGKGKARHANNDNFEDQPILAETRAVGIGFVAGQARKKILEATRYYQEHPERAIADLLGAINYIAAEVIYIEEQNKVEELKAK